MKRVAKVICIFSALMFLGFTMAGPALAEKIKVGVMLPLTGKLAKFGEIENKSFLMAVDEINAAGGVNGKQIDLIVEDTMGKPDAGRSAIEKLILRDHVIAIGGGYSSSVTWATIAIAQQNKVPFLSTHVRPSSYREESCARSILCYCSTKARIRTLVEREYGNRDCQTTMIHAIMRLHLPGSGDTEE